jgi:hypothetical protein
MKQELDDGGYRDVLISFPVNSRGNKLLSQAAERAGRTKRQEAKLRLHDHLEKFQSISEVNKAEERV